MTQRNAEIEGNKLLKRMKGKGWKLDVWENGGWHYRVYLPVGVWNLSVYTSPFREETKYYTLLGKGGSGGEVYWGARGLEFIDPNEAVRVQMDLVRDFIYERAEMFTDLEEALDG